MNGTTTTSSERTMVGAEWAMLLALSLLWGGSFFFNAIAVRKLPPLTIVLVRVALAALILHIAVRLLGERMPTDRRVWAAFLGMGLLNNVLPFTLIVWGQVHIASGLAAILNATTPLWTVLVAHLLTSDEKLTGLRLAGVALGLAGTVLMVGPAALHELAGELVPQLAVLGAAISYALAGVYGRRFKRLAVPALPTAAGQVTASALVLLPSVLVADRPWTLAMPGLPTWAALLGLAALSTALAYVLYFRILAAAGATNLLLVTFLIPVTAVLLGALVLGERLDARHLAGMALIGSGLAAIDGRLLRRPQPAARRGAPGMGSPARPTACSECEWNSRR